MESKSFKCPCGKTYNQQPSLCRHHKSCEIYLNNTTQFPVSTKTENRATLVETPVGNKVQELQEQNQELIRENMVLREQIKSFNEQKMLQDQIKSLYEQNQKILQEQIKQLQEQIKQLQEQIKQLQEQIKQLQEQLLATSAIPIVTVEKEKEQEQKEKVTQQNKKAHVKSYLAGCNPITYTEFMDSYIPTADDYSNILRTGLTNGIVTNIMNYLSKYEKRSFPFVISNNQNIRLRLYIYDKKENDNVNEWNVVIGYEAVKILENMVRRFINKLYTHFNTVFKPAYPGIDDATHKDHITHSRYRYTIGSTLGNADDKINGIANTVKQYFCIVENDDGEDSDTTN